VLKNVPGIAVFGSHEARIAFFQDSDNMKNFWRWGILAIAVLLGGGIWHASQHSPTGPAEGVEIQGMEFLHEKVSRDVPVPGDNSRFPSIRLATFNLHGCKGLDGQVDVTRSAKCLENLDFAALEEVHGPGFFSGENQAALLGKRLEMAWLFTPSVRQWYALESGNGFLTSLPVSFWQRIPLQSHRDYSFRNAVLLGLRQKNGAGRERIVHVLLTHVNRRYDEDREAQLRAVIALFLSLQEPAVLLGDLNSTVKDPQIAKLLSDTQVIDAVGTVVDTKTTDSGRIDWIFCRGLKPLRSGVVENDASDHPVVWAELE
jgi:endonuclease/exonuclease/phosphatase family metal-dependent hydrolase